MGSTFLQRQHVDTATMSPAVLAKWPENLLREGFIPFPKRVLRALSHLYPNDRAMEELVVLLAAADFRRPNLKQQPSLEFLTFISGLEPERFRAALDRLANKSFVEPEGSKEALEINSTKFFDKVREATAAERD